MRTSAAARDLCKKFISTFFAATLALGLVPAAAFAAPEDATIAANETTATDDGSAENIATAEGPEAPAADIEVPEGGMEAPDIISDEVALDVSADAVIGEDISIPAAMERINEDVSLTQPVAQQESARSYFLAQTLGSTRTVPMVSADLPLDTGSCAEGASSEEGTTEPNEGDDSDESDPTEPPSITIEVSPESTIVGSFEYQGMTFAIEPGGETVALVALDYMKLPKVFPNSNAMAMPASATVDGIDYFSVTRIADYAFSSLTSELAHACVFSDEGGWCEGDFADIPRIEVIEEPDLPEDVVGGLPPLAQGIKVVVIPASVTSIGDAAFSGFDTLQYIVVEEGNPSYASYDGALYSADLTNLRLIPEGRVGAVRVAPSATSVEPEVFSHCTLVDTLVADPESEIWQKLQESDPCNVNGYPIDIIDASEVEARELAAPYAIDVNTIGTLRDAAASEAQASIASGFSTLGDGDLGFSLEERSVSNSTVKKIEFNHSDTTKGIEITLCADGPLKSGSTTERTPAYFVAGIINAGIARKMTYTSASGTEVTTYGLTIKKFTPYKDGQTTRGYTPTSNAEISTTLNKITIARDMVWSTPTGQTKLNVGDAFAKWYGGGDKPTAFNCYNCYASITAGYIEKLSTGFSSEEEAEAAGTMRFCEDCLTVWDVNSDGTGTISNRTTYNSSMCGTYTPAWTAVEGTLDANHGLFKLSDGREVPFINVYTTTKNGTEAWNYLPGTVATSANLTRLGYTLDTKTGGMNGLSTSIATGNVPFYYTGKPTDPGNQKYYARWKANTYTVNYYNHDGTTLISSNKDCEYDTAFNLLAKPSTGVRPGYAAQGWSRSKDQESAGMEGTKKLNFSTSVKNLTAANNGTVNLYLAEYRVQTDLTFSLNTSDTKASGTLPTNLKATCELAMPTYGQNAPERPGYTFQGFYDTSSSTGGTCYYELDASGNVVSATSWNKPKTPTQTLYARWSINAKKYVSLNKNHSDASTSMSYVYQWVGRGWYSSYPSDSSTALSSITYPTRSGYRCMGYASSSSASSAEYWTWASINPSYRTEFPYSTLYAVWKAETKLKFDWNADGDTVTGVIPPSSGDDQLIAVQGQDMPQYYFYPGALPQRKGWTFLGWYDGTTSSATQYYMYESQSYGAGRYVSTRQWDYTTPGECTLYARWEKDVRNYPVYKISFDANGGEIPWPNVDGNCIFLWYDMGWYKDAALTSSATATVDVRKPGYTLLGFSESKTATKADHFTNVLDYYGNFCGTLPSLNTYFSSNKTLYAVWGRGPNSAVIHLEDWMETGETIDALYYWAEKGLVAGETSETLVGSGDYVMPSGWKAPKKDGYTFKGYYAGLHTYECLLPEGTGTQMITADGKLTDEGSKQTAEATWYAACVPNTYAIRYDGNGNTGGSTADTTGCVYDKNVTLAKNGFTKTGWTFNKWNTKADGSGTSFEANKATTTPPNLNDGVTDSGFGKGIVKLYATWTANNYTIVYDGNTNTGGSTAATTGCTYDSNVVLASNGFTKTGYHFNKWNTKSDGTGTAYTAGATATKPNLSTDNDGTGTLYATWTANTYKIAYNGNGNTGGSTADTTGCTYDSDVVLASNGFTKTGYHFNEWNTESDGTGTGYGSGATAVKPNLTTTDNGTGTLYATWTINEYRVYWKYNGGDGGADFDEPVEYDKPVPMKDPGKNLGYYFTGWKASGADTSTYDKDDIYTMKDGHITFEAQWTLNPHVKVNLSDERLSEPTAMEALWYWPGQGFVKSDESETSPKKTGDRVMDRPEVEGYEFLGWFDVQAQNENSDIHKMIDADGRLFAQIEPEETVTWWAHWKRVSCPVVLKAEYDDILYVTNLGAPPGFTAEFEKPFSASLTDGELADTPKRTGYTFKGYYTSPNPELSESDVSDNLFVGRQWIDSDGRLSSNAWKEYPSEERASITLYAAWMLDDIEVVFDVKRIDAETELPANTEAVQGKPANQIWHYGKPLPSALPTPEDGSFVRNGYNFCAWYYVKEGKKAYVSDSEGNPTLSAWMSAVDSVTLYPEWTAKEYTLSFGANYPVFDGIEVESDDAVERDFAYDDEFAVSDLKPAFKEYVFAGWYAKTTGELVLGYDSDGDTVEGRHVTHGRFTPQGDLALQTNEGGAVIEVEGRWNEPGQANYTLYAARPDGTGDVWERTLDYGYTEPVVLSMAPPANLFMDGYRFAGWVEVEDPTKASEAAGRGGGEGATTPSFGPLSSGDRYFVAKWSTFDLGVTLTQLLATDALTDHERAEGDEEALAWSAACGDDVTDSARTWEILYDVKKEPFALPDVVRQGKVFKGWKRAGAPDSEFEPYVVVNPSSQAGSATDYVLEYVPVFEEATYTIILDANEVGLEDQRHTVTYSGSFTFPYPTALNTGSCFACWAEKPYVQSEHTKTFFPDAGEIPVAPVYGADGKVEEFGLAQLANAKNEIRLYAVWDSMYNVDVPLFANLAIDTETGDVIAGTSVLSPKNPTDESGTYRIESLRYEPMLTNGHVAFERPGTPSDKVYLSVYAGLSLGEDADEEHLLYASNVGEDGEIAYVGADDAQYKIKPLLIELGGDTPRLYGRTAPSEQPSLESVTDHDASYGFIGFGNDNPLTIRYGLYFENPQTRKDFAFSSDKYDWLLPRNDASNKATSDDPKKADYGRRTTWSSGTVDIARLCYTVSRTAN